MAGRAEHRALRACGRGSRGRRVVAVVGLDLDDRAADAVDEQRRADQLGRDLVDAAGEERRGSRLRRAALRPRRALRRRLEQAPGAAAEVDDVEAALLGGLGDPLGEVERLVERAGRSAPGLAPIAARIARSVREATIGSAIPSTQTRVRAPWPRSPRRAARARRSCRRGRTCRSRGRSSVRGQPSALSPAALGSQVRQTAWRIAAAARGATSSILEPRAGFGLAGSVTNG